MTLTLEFPRLISISRRRWIPGRCFIGKRRAADLSGPSETVRCSWSSAVRFCVPKWHRLPADLEKNAQDAHATVAHYFALDHPLGEICDFISGRSGDERRPRFLSRVADHSAAEMGMSRHIHLFVDETGGAYSANFAGAAKTLWCSNARSAITWFTPFLRRSDWRELPRRNCANASSAIVPKTCVLRRGSSAPAKRISRRGRRFADADLRKRLCALPGVGPKIANCVMLFAYERLRAFPIDVWIERVLRQQYFPSRKKMTAQRLREFSETYFGEHGGYAQQYLFHHARTGLRKLRRVT